MCRIQIAHSPADNSVMVQSSPTSIGLMTLSQWFAQNWILAMNDDAITLYKKPVESAFAF